MARTSWPQALHHFHSHSPCGLSGHGYVWVRTCLGQRPTLALALACLAGWTPITDPCRGAWLSHGFQGSKSGLNFSSSCPERWFTMEPRALPPSSAPAYSLDMQIAGATHALQTPGRPRLLAGSLAPPQALPGGRGGRRLQYSLCSDGYSRVGRYTEGRRFCERGAVG